MNQQFSYTYDSYKRVTQINLGQTVIRQFYYDTNPLDGTGTFSQYSNGRLTAVQNAATTNGDTFIEMYSYNGLTYQPQRRVASFFQLGYRGPHWLAGTVTTLVDWAHRFGHAEIPEDARRR